MKLAYLICGLSLFAAPTASATIVGKVGTVANISATDGTALPGGVNWFQLNGVNSAFNCPLQSNLVAISVRDDDRGKQQLSLVHAALLSGKQIQVQLDDTKLVGGYCVAEYVKLVP